VTLPRESPKLTPAPPSATISLYLRVYSDARMAPNAGVAMRGTGRASFPMDPSANQNLHSSDASEHDTKNKTNKYKQLPSYNVPPSTIATGISLQARRLCVCGRVCDTRTLHPGPLVTSLKFIRHTCMMLSIQSPLGPLP
jgi:hypothetical protein